MSTKGRVKRANETVKERLGEDEESSEWTRVWRRKLEYQREA